jgi:hypothetical protein
MWSEAQRAEVAREYQRIGIRAGERLPAPAFDDPVLILALLGQIPDGAGAAGYVKALREFKP